MDAGLATTYTLIHSFLRKHSHTRAALAVKKAAKDIVVLKDDIEIEEPHLDTIIQEWKASRKVATQFSSSDSSSDSNSEDSSDSSESSSDSSDSSDDSSGSSDETSTPTQRVIPKPEKPHKRVKMKVKSKTASSSDESSSASSGSDSSDSDSESSDSNTKTIKPDQKLIKTKYAGKHKVERQSSQTLTSGNNSSFSVASDRKRKETADNSDSSDSDDDAVVKPKPAEKASVTSTEKAESRATEQNKNKKGPSSSSISDSSSSDSDSSIAEDKPEKPNKKRTTMSSSDATPAPATKKRKTTEDGASVVTATTETAELLKSGPQFSGRVKANGKPARKTNTPFKRINPEKIDQQSLLQDNGYMAKAAPTNDYGARAHQDLIVTRGAGFRKEKNKKKRGSYKGGTITLESHSFKFT